MLTSDCTVMKVIWHQISPPAAGRAADPLRPHPCDNEVGRSCYLIGVINVRNMAGRDQQVPDPQILYALD